MYPTDFLITMKILEIELIGFLGLWLNNINYFKLIIVSRVVLLLGRNGCGKTRLMAQLQPFAIAKKDFSKNGSKTVKFEVDHVIYLAVSKFDGSSIKNTLTNLTTGEVLHTDVNPTYHNEVVARLTRWSLALHGLNCFEDEHLTRMRSSDRKHWFGKLSESDLAYALKFYNKLKEEQRDILGALRQLKIEISELQLKVTDTEAEYVQISMSLDTLNEKYSTLSTRCDELSKDLCDVDDVTLRQALSRLKETANEILALNADKCPELESQNEWELVHQVATAEAANQHTLKLWTDLEKTLADLTTNTEAIDDLKRWIEDDNKAIDALVPLIHHPQVLQSLTTYNTDYTEILRTYMDYQAVKHSDTPVTNQIIQTQHSVLDEINSSYYRCDAFMQYATDKIAEYEASTRTECPECHHEFVVGMSEQQLSELKRKLELATAKRAELAEVREKEHAKLIKLIAELNAQTALETAIDKLRTENPIDYLILRDTDFFSIVGVIKTLESDWAYQSKLLALCKSRDALALRLAKASKSTPEALDALSQQIQATKHDHYMANTAYEVAKAKLTTFQNYQAQQQRLLELEHQLDICYNNAVTTEIALLSQAEYDDLTGELLRLSQLIETTKSRYLLMHDNRVKLSQLTQRLQTLDNELSVCATLVKAMGPEEGLLAKHLFRSITRVVDRMNTFIEQVWGYKLKILPCQLDGGELDYQFPYLLKENEKPVEDVSAASVGQRKLFDLAFLLTIYGVLGLGSMPLYLDEMLNGFDEEHKDSIIKYLNTMLERGVYSQMFMISHDPNIHFQLSYADYVVIDSNGISLPKVYNQNVIIR